LHLDFEVDGVPDERCDHSVEQTDILDERLLESAPGPVSVGFSVAKVR
jgi:hypothetical protein